MTVKEYYKEQPDHYECGAIIGGNTLHGGENWAGDQ